MANVLPFEKQIAIVAGLTEGCSVRSVERMVGVNRRTVLSLLTRVGEGCERLMDKEMRGLKSTHLELDEIWSYIGKKERHIKEGDNVERVGDCWTYVALCADTKLIPSFRVSRRRTAEDTNAFVADLSTRLVNRVQISTDGLRLYVDAVDRAFGSEVDYGQIVKTFAVEQSGPGRYSPPKVETVETFVIAGQPDKKKISTSYVERSNLTTRMRIRRFTRLTNGFSKKPENHHAAIALHFAHYNYVATHRTLRVTPAMAAGVSNTLWSVGDLVERALAA